MAEAFLFYFILFLSRPMHEGKHKAQHTSFNGYHLYKAASHISFLFHVNNTPFSVTPM